MARDRGQQEYKPLIAKCRLKTKMTMEEAKKKLEGQGFTAKQLQSVVASSEYTDGLVVYLSKWNYDNHERWHLWNWENEDDGKIMMALYEAEQYKPFTFYKNNAEDFVKDWQAGEYDPGMTYTFADNTVEVLEVIQEEVDTVNHRETKRLAAQARDERMRRLHRKRKERASKGKRYAKKYF